MKPAGQNPKQQRPRGRNNGGGGGGGGGGGSRGRMPQRNTTFDSNGPDIRIRGNAHQVLEKYLAMARDASSQGDRIAAENYYQHAEHYFRVINNQNQSNGGRPQGQRPLSTPADNEVMLSDEDCEDGDANGGSATAETGEGDQEGGQGGGEDQAEAVSA